MNNSFVELSDVRLKKYMLNSVCKTKRVCVTKQWLFVLNRVRSGHWLPRNKTNQLSSLSWSLFVVAKGHAVLTAVLKQCIWKLRNVPSYGGQSKHAKIASHWKWLNIYPTSGSAHSATNPGRVASRFISTIIYLLLGRWSSRSTYSVKNKIKCHFFFSFL